ncbi:MAG: hypothetical protein R3E68_05480 [Burkholderiaceae bacterium]
MLSSHPLFLVALILAAAALGFAVAWLWRGREHQQIDRQARKLRRDRRVMQQQMADLNARLDANMAGTRIAEEELAMLNQVHATLEGEHARLVSKYANLTRAARQNLQSGGDTRLDDERADDDRSSDDLRSLLDDSVGETDPQESQTFEPGPSDWRDEDLAGDGLQSETDQPPSSDPASDWFEETAAIDEEALPSRIKDGQNELEVLKAQLAAAQAGIGESLGQLPQAPEAPASADDTAALDTRDPLADAADQLRALQQALEGRDQEIRRLREQLAPLLGLPLAVSTREAERDRLARRLAEREAELARLNAELRQSRYSASPDSDPRLAIPDAKALADPPAHEEPDAVSPDQDEPTDADDPIGRIQSGLPDGSLPSDLTLEDLGALRADMEALDEPAIRDDQEIWPESDRLSPPSVGRPAQSPRAPSERPPPAGSSPARLPRQYDQAPETVDDLQRISGIGTALEHQLNRLGVYRLAQIAAWTDDDVAFFDRQLNDFRGRIRRDQWVRQAREMTRGDTR